MNLAGHHNLPTMSDHLGLLLAADESGATLRRETEQELATKTLLDFLNTEKLESGGGGGASTVTTAIGSSYDTTRSESSSSPSRSRPDQDQQHHQTSSGLWGVLKQRLRLKGIACCGAIIDCPHSQDSSSSSPMPIVRDQSENGDNIDADEEGYELIPPVLVEASDRLQITTSNTNTTSLSPQAASDDNEAEVVGGGDDDGVQAAGVNLAAEPELSQVSTMVTRRDQRGGNTDNHHDAAEPEMGATSSSMGEITEPGTPARVSLMRLMEEAKTERWLSDQQQVIIKGVAVGGDKVCCVCMEREKGAAMIPCGHTFCRVCSRELWVNRGSCPLCNREILEILDIF